MTLYRVPAQAGIHKGKKEMESYYVYILASKKNGTLYIGVTNNLAKRVHEHKTKAADGFTEKYGVDKLVYFEEYKDLSDARERELRMKKWKREWKIKRIVENNSEWLDLYEKINI